MVGKPEKYGVSDYLFYASHTDNDPFNTHKNLIKRHLNIPLDTECQV